MKITLNGLSLHTEQVTLLGLLIEQGYQGLEVATALDQIFVGKADRATTPITEGCQIEIVAPMQGG